ncbi:MAG TPA: DUF3313 domain-containing protein [Geminicoccaceae bacterium]|nr:DUF3313 domain-containing protein [Geminicoccaceae bacterium]
MRVIVLFAAVLVLAGCGSSRPVRDVQPRGFLGDYSLLTRGGSGEAALRYINADADWASYDKVIVEPVEVWAPGGTTAVPEEDLKTAADYLYAQLRAELGKDFQLVDQPGPDTLRVEAALTGAERANQMMVAVSSVVPMAAAVSGSYEYITGKPTFQGRAAVEAKVTDARTGELLAAAVDERMGGRALNSAANEWTDVHNILAYWAQQTRFRLCELQERTGCQPPQTGGL